MPNYVKEGDYAEFCRLLDSYLEPTLDYNIIIYGCNNSGDFIRWYYKTYFKKDVKTIIDRWELSSTATVPHLWSLYYIYNEADIIINTSPINLKDEFNDTGEIFDRLRYKDCQIINLWDKLYGESYKNEITQPEITYFDWMESRYQIDLLKTIKRSYVKGEHAHGYFPTDFRIFVEGIQKVGIPTDSDAVLDIGSGKGSAVIALKAIGFKNIGAVEYTEKIYQTLIDNLNKIGIVYTEKSMEHNDTSISIGISCYLGDAVQLNKELDGYNWFFLFNPFSWEVTEQVLENICKSMERKKRKIFIFYAEPIGHQLIMETEKFKVTERICSNLSGVSYYSYIYESIV